MTIGAVRRDADTTLVGTTNEFGPLQMDANGRLKVEAFSGETLPVSLTSTTVTGTVAVTQSGTWDEVGINDSGNSITVDNGGTFAVQAACTLDAETTKVIGTVRMASGGVASGSFASGALAAGAVTDLPLPSGASTSANQLPATSGGISTVYRDEDTDETAVAIKASAGQIYWIHCINLDATPVYLHFYNVAQGSVTVGTTGELCSFAVPTQGDANGAGFTMHFNHGIAFGTAITVACTTTINGTTGPGANEVILNVGYA
jgi:hypothetical protein